MTTIYDVRFTADSVLERCCKAIHLGVMVGFSEIGTSFDPDDQIKSIFRAMSFFLMMSRLALALQYGVVAWQIRKYVDGRRPMLLTSVLNLIAAMVYLGVSFKYEHGKNSRVYVVWYVVGIVEMALHLGFSQLVEVLTFIGSHLGERLNLLTLIVLGEGTSSVGCGTRALHLTWCRRYDISKKRNSRCQRHVSEIRNPVDVE
jgi:low temperature requirement protein LtrA